MSAPVLPGHVTGRWSQWWSVEQPSSRRYRLAFAALFVFHGAVLGFVAGRYLR